MILCDAHCHLYAVENLEEEIKRCKDLGFGGILCVSEDLKTMEETLKIRDKFGEIIYPGLGIHPSVISLSSEEELENAFNFLKKHIKDAFCIGEIGLDFKYAREEKEKEKQYFWLQKQLQLASQEKKPINLHSRRALRETLKVAEDFHKETGLNSLLHWFTHSKKLIKIAMEKGIYVSAGPSILFSNETFEVAKEIDKEKLLLETDSPVPFDGKPAKPSWILNILEKFSKEYKENVSDFSQKIYRNFKEYLSI